MYSLEVPDKLKKELIKLTKKDPKQSRIIANKIRQILENPQHFKPLRGDMFGARRVHIDKSFVLTYEIDEQNKAVKLLDYDHHDRIF